MLALLVLGWVVLLDGWASAGTAKLAIVRASGVVVPENSQLVVGEKVSVHVSGFGPKTVVVVQFGTLAVPATVVTAADGTASVPMTVPKVPADVYVLTASSDMTSADFVVTVDTTAPVSSTPAPTAAAATSASSSAPSLAHSGAPATLPTTLTAAVLMAFGAAMIRVGAPILRGRHEGSPDVPERITGRHAR